MIHNELIISVNRRNFHSFEPDAQKHNEQQSNTSYEPNKKKTSIDTEQSINI